MVCSRAFGHVLDELGGGLAMRVLEVLWLLSGPEMLSISGLIRRL